MAEISKKIGEMNFDGLISDTKPFVEVGGGVIAKGAKSYKRGTIMAKDAGGKLVPLKATLVPYGILCDDITVTATEDESVAVYTAGCFDSDLVSADEAYTITDENIDQLRMRNIVFKSAQKN